MNLHEFWCAHPRAALAFSGGVDSAYLLYSAQQSGADVRAYFVKTEFQPQFELDDAMRLADSLGAPLVVLEASALADETIAGNPDNRCYYCKQRIFGAILARAAADGYSLVLDGTNADDDAAQRPGMRASLELAVLSPLQLCGLSKDEIRTRSREAGLFTWDKPAYACLATRIPSGTRITAADLQTIEQAEDALSAMGFSDFRVRKTADGAKLQFPESQLSAALAQRNEILKRLSPFFSAVTLDLQPRADSTSAYGSIQHECVTELRCNLDDMTGEDIGFACELLLSHGALDVWTTPITMKKSRPAILLTCLCRAQDASAFTALMLRHTTTLGVRKSECERTCLSRRIETRGGLRVKIAEGDGIYKEKAEFEDLAALALREKLTLAEARKLNQ